MRGIFKRSTPNDRLVQARIERGLTNKQIADRMDISLVTYNRWEQGRQKPGLRRLRLLCEILQKECEELGYNPND
jgi:transcriptional regulator with XRE-family HTH domain